MKEKEFIVLKHLRSNARKQFTQISRETGIPVTTVYDQYHKLKKNFIKKEVSLVDFPKMGYHFTIFILIEEPGKKIIEYLKKESSVNNLFFLKDNVLLIEAIFKDKGEQNSFMKTLNSFLLGKISSHPLIEEFKREDFFPDAENFINQDTL